MAQRDAPLACTLSLRQTSGHPYFSHWQKAIGIMAAANPALRHGLAHSAVSSPPSQWPYCIVSCCLRASHLDSTTEGEGLGRESGGNQKQAEEAR